MSENLGSPNTLKIRNLELNWRTRTYIMGILNITPDSFSGDGSILNNQSLDDIAQRAKQMASDGADIIDIGAESTRPKAVKISANEELSRLLPALEAIRSSVGVPISVDTYKAAVAKEALSRGADIINDVWALEADENLVKVAADHQAPVILMHNKSNENFTSHDQTLGGTYSGIQYDNLLAEISEYLLRRSKFAIDRGISSKNIILDPGFGFGKTVQQNICLLKDLKTLELKGFPLLAGVSRKSFVGHTLNLPPESRLEGTAAAITMCIERGADIVRVHDVRAMKRVAEMTDAVVRTNVMPHK